jgi:hypothetical protein
VEKDTLIALIVKAKVEKVVVLEVVLMNVRTVKVLVEKNVIFVKEKVINK